MRSLLSLLPMLVLVSPLLAAEPATKPVTRHTYNLGEKVCKNLSLSALSGKSPWLVMGVGGAYEYFTASETERVDRSVFASPWVWSSILTLVLLVLLKDTILSAASYLKVPLNALAEALHMSGWLVGLLYLGTSVAGGEAAVSGGATASLGMPVFAVEGTIPSSDSWLSAALLWLVMCVVHTAVWIVFNTVEVLIILNPIPFVDTALKSIRTTILAIIALAAQVHPMLGFALALPIIICCFWFLPFSMRFLVVGWVFTVDTVRNWFGTRSVLPQPIRAFSSWSLTGVPFLTYGRVERTGNGIEFIARPYWFRTRRIIIPSDGGKIWSGILAPVLALGLGNVYLTQLRFSPRYVGLETQLSNQLSLGDTSDGSIGGSFRAVVRQVSTWMLSMRRLPS